MKIAFYSPNKPLSHPNPSGDLAIARGICAALVASGHECREIIDFRSRWFWTSSRGWIEALRAIGKTYRHTAAFEPEVWLTYHSYYKSPDVIGPLITSLYGIPYVLFQPMYGTKWRKDRLTRTGFYLNRIAMKSCRHAFSNNLDDLEALSKVIATHKITYLPPGIFPEEFKFDAEARQEIRSLWSIPEDMPLIMSAARLRRGVKSESIHYLLKSLSRIDGRLVSFKLMIVGDGPMEDEIRSAAGMLLPERTIFVGKVDRKDMSRYYSASDLFVVPGRGESLGMVFLEAQACGLPVVALDTAGVPQVVRKGITALLVPNDEGEAMAEAVRTLILDKSFRSMLGQNGKKFVREERNLHQNYMKLSEDLKNFKPKLPNSATCQKSWTQAPIKVSEETTLNPRQWPHPPR
jgi:glycosyltransferase involved in cell wall biosynthesis